MSIVCKTCTKDLFKSDGTGPYACPSCVVTRIEAIDSTTGELVELKVNGKPRSAGKSQQQLMINLIKDTRFSANLPPRQEFPEMLKLQSKHFRGIETLNGVMCKFDKNGIALVEAHNKQFIDRWIDLVPNRVSWVNEAVELVLPVIESIEPVEIEVIPEDIVKAPSKKKVRSKKKGS